MKIEPTYLGDSVYASFDGYHINLKLYDHRSDTLIALDPYVMQALIKYAEAINEKLKENSDEKSNRNN